MAKIFISTTSFAKFDSTTLEYCRKGNEVKLNPFARKLTSEELIGLAKDSEGIIAGTELYDRNVLEGLPKLKVISRCGVGLDNIDIEAASELGIKIYNTADAPTLAVAELTIGLILDLLRKISLMDRQLRKGTWQKYMGNLLEGKNIGIIGFGRIGKKVAEILFSFKTNIAYYDICTKDANAAYVFKTMQDLLSWADIVTLHCSASAEAGEIIGKGELSHMKRGAYLINVARGSLIDEEALYMCLKDGHLAGAALDVFKKEPYTGKLSKLDNVILTPHIGSYALECRVEMEMQAVKNLLEGL